MCPNLENAFIWLAGGPNEPGRECAIFVEFQIIECVKQHCTPFSIDVVFTQYRKIRPHVPEFCILVNMIYLYFHAVTGRGEHSHFLVLSLHMLNPIIIMSWWRHQMGTFSALLAICAGNSPVTGEFPAQRPVTRSFDVSFELRLNKRLSKRSWGWWFKTLSPHYDVIVM